VADQRRTVPAGYAPRRIATAPTCIGTATTAARAVWYALSRLLAHSVLAKAFVKIANDGTESTVTITFVSTERNRS
jgi:hypothetical protein